MFGAIAQGVLGLGQAVLGGIKQNKAIKQLEKMQSPTYKQNAGVLDYYNKALSKYNVNPYQSDMYRMQEQQANRGLASGISALQGRGQALAGINSLVQGRNDNLLKAGAMAEQQRDADLNRLGQASGMKAGEDMAAFNINQQQPFERKYNLLAQKAGGGAQTANAGISNIFGGIQSYDQNRMLDKMYSSNSGGGSNVNYGDTVNPTSVLRNLYRNQNRRVG
jgi:hypothetical protein